MQRIDKLYLLTAIAHAALDTFESSLEREDPRAEGTHTRYGLPIPRVKPITEMRVETRIEGISAINHVVQLADGKRIATDASELGTGNEDMSAPIYGQS